MADCASERNGALYVVVYWQSKLREDDPGALEPAARVLAADFAIDTCGLAAAPQAARGRELLLAVVRMLSALGRG